MLGQTDGWARTLVYGAAHFSKSLFWYGGEILFAFFLTDVAGLEPASMGSVLGLGFLASAVCDIVVGRWMTRHGETVAKAAFLQMIGAFAAGVVLVGFFATPFLPPTQRLAWALVTGLLFRLAFAIYDVPQGALMALAPADGTARARVAGVRITGSGLAILVVAALVGPLIAAVRVGEGGTLMISLAGGAALVGGLTAVWLWRSLRSAAPAAWRPQASVGSASSMTASLWPAWCMMAAMMLGPPLFQKLEPYFASRALPSVAVGGAIIIAVALGVTIAQPVWLRFGAPRHRLPLFLVTASLQAVGALLFWVTPIARPEILVFAAWLFGVGNGGVGMAKWATHSDAVARRPAAERGLCFAIFGAIAKIALAVGVMIVARVVDLSAHDPAILRKVMAVGPFAASLLIVGLVLAARRWVAAPVTIRI